MLRIEIIVVFLWRILKNGMMRATTYNNMKNEEMVMLGGTPSSASFDSIMGYLHSVPISFNTKKSIYQQLQAEVLEEQLRVFKEKLEAISGLKEDWDGYDAVPISPITINNFSKVLDTCKPSDFEEWTLSPNTNGTLLLEREEAAISIASKEFSFYAEQEGRYMEDNHHAFSVSALLHAVRQINTFLSE